MSDTQRTPGVWTADDSHTICTATDDLKGLPIARCHVLRLGPIGVISEAQAAANARLMAAAPDMLEALIGVVRVADRQTVEFDAARAAITKATGWADGAMGDLPDAQA